MSGGKRGKRSRSGLTPDEQALWDHAAASMTRLANAKDRIPDGPDPASFDADGFHAAMAGVQRRAAAETPSGKAMARKGMPPPFALPGLPSPPPPAKKSRSPELTAFDRKSAKRLRAGGIEIEARLDLHGMRQDEAHGALRRFLASCQSRELRWVLVITGKGAPERSGWFGDDGDPHPGSGGPSGADPWDRAAPRGIIRRNIAG